MTISDPSSHPSITWFHKKTGDEYEILDHGLQEANLEPVVIYKSVRGGPTWVRPARDFFDGRFVNSRPEENVLEPIKKDW